MDFHDVGTIFEAKIDPKSDLGAKIGPSRGSKRSPGEAPEAQNRPRKSPKRGPEEAPEAPNRPREGPKRENPDVGRSGAAPGPSWNVPGPVWVRFGAQLGPQNGLKIGAMPLQTEFLLVSGWILKRKIGFKEAQVGTKILSKVDMAVNQEKPTKR